MANSTLAGVLSLALALAFVGGARLTAGTPVAADVLDGTEVRSLRDRLRKEDTARRVALEAARQQLSRADLSEARAARLAEGIRTRMLRELEGYVGLLRGRSFASVEDAWESIRARERILCHVAVGWPVAYGDGKPLTFVVDESDAERFRLGLPSHVHSQEVELRDAVREKVRLGELTWQDARLLKEYSRARARARGKEIVDEMLGAAFFTEADALMYVESAVRAELDDILRALRDPQRGPVLLESARTGFSG